MTEFTDAAPDDCVAPGQTTKVVVDGVAVGLANIDGTFWAFANECPHQSRSLTGRPLTRGRFVTCPGHGSMFDVTTGQCVLPSRDGWSGELRTYQARTIDGSVQVCLD